MAYCVPVLLENHPLIQKLGHFYSKFKYQINVKKEKVSSFLNSIT